MQHTNETVPNTINGLTYSVSYNDIQHCPVCKFSIDPREIYKIISKKNDDFILSVLYYCTHCKSTFMTQYILAPTGATNTFKALGVLLSVPNTIIETPFGEEIRQISPAFIKIYNQAIAAESLQLDQISGIGLRKALEFLIKDFTIANHPEDQEKISQMQLMQCINTYIDDPHLKTASSRAVWLANDQTHYIQKFEDKDIQDLKRLITATVHWISMLHVTAEAELINP